MAAGNAVLLKAAGGVLGTIVLPLTLAASPMPEQLLALTETDD